MKVPNDIRLLPHVKSRQSEILLPAEEFVFSAGDLSFQHTAHCDTVNPERVILYLAQKNGDRLHSVSVSVYFKFCP